MKQEKKRSSLSRLLSYAGGHRALTVLGCVLSGIAAVLGLAPYFCIWLVARDTLAVFPDFSAATGLTTWGWMAVWFAVANIVFYFAALMCTHIAAFRTARNIRRAAMRHVVSLPLGFFSGSQSGRLRKLIDDNAGLTEDLLAHKLPDLTAALVTPVAAILLLFVFDWRMGLACLLTMVLAMVCMMSMMGGKNAGFFHRYQQEIEKMSGEAVEYVRGIPVVKVFQQTVYSFKAFHDAIAEYADMAQSYAGTFCRGPQVLNLTALNGLVAFLLPVALLLAPGETDFAHFMANFTFYAIFSAVVPTAMTKLMFVGEASQMSADSLARIRSIMDSKQLSVPAQPKRPAGSDVRFEDVSFTYEGAEAPAVNHASFSVSAGSTLALVGPSGGGKSTCASLIPRFWDVSSGRVLVGGVDVRDMDPHELMDQVAFVFQTNQLFRQTLADNVRASKPTATDDEVRAALSAAQCDDIVAKLPQGINTMLGAGGAYLSGGEVQRVALARAILKDAPIVVLDEATAFADPENEALIQRAFSKLAAGRTVIMIAHRLSTVVGADQIVVLNQGSVQESGTHAELLSQEGLYAKMWAEYERAASWKITAAAADDAVTKGGEA